MAMAVRISKSENTENVNIMGSSPRRNYSSDDSMSVSDTFRKHQSRFRDLAEAQIDTNKTLDYHSRRLNELMASARSGAAQQLHLAERTTALENNLAATQVAVTQLGDGVASVVGRTETLEDEVLSLTQQLQEANAKMDHVVAVAVANKMTNYRRHGRHGGQGQGHGENKPSRPRIFNVRSAFAPAPARYKTKCPYCPKIILHVLPHIKERCHFAPLELLSLAGRNRQAGMMDCDICGGRFKQRSLNRHRAFCGRGRGRTTGRTRRT